MLLLKQTICFMRHIALFRTYSNKFLRKKFSKGKVCKKKKLTV